MGGPAQAGEWLSSRGRAQAGAGLRVGAWGGSEGPGRGGEKRRSAEKEKQESAGKPRGRPRAGEKCGMPRDPGRGKRIGQLPIVEVAPNTRGARALGELCFSGAQVGVTCQPLADTRPLCFLERLPPLTVMLSRKVSLGSPHAGFPRPQGTQSIGEPTGGASNPTGTLGGAQALWWAPLPCLLAGGAAARTPPGRVPQATWSAAVLEVGPPRLWAPPAL